MGKEIRWPNRPADSYPATGIFLWSPFVRITSMSFVSWVMMNILIDRLSSLSFVMHLTLRIRTILLHLSSIHTAFIDWLKFPSWRIFKGTVSRDFFASGFFHESSSPKPLKITLGSFRIFLENSRGYSQVKVHHRYRRHRPQICLGETDSWKAWSRKPRGTVPLNSYLLL